MKTKAQISCTVAAQLIGPLIRRLLTRYSYYNMHLLSVTDGYAPFLSMTSRETFLNISDQVVAAPGPGHYDPRFAQDNVKVGLYNMF